MREVLSGAAKDLLPVFYILEYRADLNDISGSVPVISVDALDVVAIYRVAHESIKRAREGAGPTIMACAKWPDENEPQDPLDKLEHYLTRKKIFHANWKQPDEERSGDTVENVLTTSELHFRLLVRTDSSL